MGEMAKNSGGSGGRARVAEETAVRWESFLPKRVLTVLLVEADDSTSQIISALLQKCSYKVVVASDGLMAWELLKGNPNNFDLILTEVELPAISGFALLTLITEHEACKNIPIIMMSAEDSVSTVYNCMLRGAVDFLVKPVRKNELRNLWQHVWRRQAQSSSGEPGPQVESKAQLKIEATAENKSNDSCDLVCILKNREFIEKGNDAQSSCTKPFDAEVAEPDCALGLLPSMSIKNREIFPMTDKKVAEESKEPARLTAQDSDSVKEVIDLIGAFDDYLKRARRTSGTENIAASNMVNPLPELELSLKRDSSSISVDEVSEEKNILNHSESSAFSRYVNRSVLLQLPSSPASCSQPKSVSELSLALPVETESKAPLSEFKLLSASVAAGRGIRYDDNMSKMFRPQSSLSAMHSPTSGNAVYQLSPPSLGLMAPNPSDMAVDRNEHKMEIVSSATDNSGNSSFQKILNIGKEKVDVAAPFLAPPEYNLGETFRLSEGSSGIKSAQREAALEKFRQKRKDRCFEKKVRYESRKKLAEKRPRIKGQFVRQAAEESSSPGEAPAE